MAYNVTAVNGTGFVEIARMVNSFTQDYFWFTILLVTLFITYSLISAFGSRVGIGVVTFLGFILGLLLRAMGLISQLQMMALIALLVLGILRLAFTSRE